ncbi:zinc finger, CCHC-type containing LTR copia-type gag-polypeptide [Tanacetum coccineum]
MVSARIFLLSRLQQIFLLLLIMTSSSSNPFDGTLPMATILHMISINLNSSNYLLWINQMTLLLSYQKLMSHIDGSVAPPSAIIIADNKELSNSTLLGLKDFKMILRVTTAQLQLLSDYYCWKEYADRDEIKD